MRPLLALLGLGIGGCAGQASCEQVAQAAAVRTWECTGHADEGYGVAKRMRGLWICADPTDEDAPVVSQRCLWEIGALPCEAVARHGADPGWWLDEAPSCGGSFSAPTAGSTGP